MNEAIKKSLMLACSTLLLAGTPWQAQALSISLYDVSSQQDEINQWITNLGGQKTVVEDFEDLGPGWYDNLTTDVGTFGLTDKTLAGTGSSSYLVKEKESGAYFELRDYDANGRFNTTDDPGSQYLDSADITEFSLDIKENSFHNLFFFMTDPSDIGAMTTITVNSLSESTNYEKENGSLWFVGIDAGVGYVPDILWSATLLDGTGYTNDGFGLDNFGTVSSNAPVPEPATMLLFGTGMAGLAGYRRRQQAKKK